MEANGSPKPSGGASPVLTLSREQPGTSVTRASLGARRPRVLPCGCSDRTGLITGSGGAVQVGNGGPTGPLTRAGEHRREPARYQRRRASLGAEKHTAPPGVLPSGAALCFRHASAMARYRDGMTESAAPERVKTTMHLPRDVYQALVDRVYEMRRDTPSTSNSTVCAEALRRFLAVS